jgi:fused signal recognition particle receptor
MSEENKGFFKGFWGKLTGTEAIPEVGSVEPDVIPLEDQSEAVQAIVQPFVEAVPELQSKPSLFQRLKQGLARTHEGLVARIDTLLLGKKQIDADTLEELEEILITADIGVPTTVELIRTLEVRLGRNELQDGAALKKALQEELLARLERYSIPLDPSAAKPFVIMVIGVNGVGKTTTIGKLASRYVGEGKKVLLAAGDTFRAAAAEQLEEWGQRAGVDVVRHQSGADPSAVVFDGCKAAVARGSDILIVDTAGRLHTKVNLMEEMKKIRRVMGREITGAPHETLLVLDAATGQNAISQARLFKEAANVSGVVLTKLDGTAKGGIVLAVSNEFQLPIRFIGIGEQAEDLRPFEPAQFVAALFD